MAPPHAARAPAPPAPAPPAAPALALASGAGSLVEAGEQQQVLRQPGEPQHVGVHVARRRLPVLPLGMVERHLELGPDRRDRAAQLVRGVGDQGALPLLRGGQPVQHVVEGQRQRPHLVPGLGHRQVRRHRGPCHPRGAPPQQVDRPQRGPDRQPDRPGEQHEHHRCPEHQRLRHHRQAAADRAVRHRGDDQGAVSSAHGRHPYQRRHPVRRPVEQRRLAVARDRRRVRRAEQRHQAVGVRGDVGDLAGGIEHLDGDVGSDRHRGRQPVGVDQRHDAGRALPGRVVDRAGQRDPQHVEQQQVDGREGDGEPERRGHRDPRPQPAPPPPAERTPGHPPAGHRTQPPSASSR